MAIAHGGSSRTVVAGPDQDGSEGVGLVEPLRACLVELDPTANPSAGALDAVLQAIRTALSVRSGRVSDAGTSTRLGTALKRAVSETRGPSLDSAWAACVSFDDPAATTLVDDALKAAAVAGGDRGLLPLLKALQSSLNLRACLAFVKQADSLWRSDAIKAPDVDATMQKSLRACIALLAGHGEPAEAQAIRRDAGVALDACLKSPSTDLRTEVAVDLARTLGEWPRGVLRRWLSGQKTVADELMVAVANALGEAGDPPAVPLLIDLIPGTHGAVLGAAILGLFRCSPAALKEHGHELFDGTIETIQHDLVLVNAFLKADRRAALEDRQRALLDPKLAADARLDVTTAGGIHSLWWKTIVAMGLEGTVPPPPARNALKRAPGGVGMQQTSASDWLGWWRVVRQTKAAK